MNELDRFYKAYKILRELEYSNDPKKFLHKNSNETGYTLGGIYQKANPKAVNWDFISSLVSLCDGDMQRASEMLYADGITRTKVLLYFKKIYWDTARLDEVQSQKICNEIFLSGVHIGVKNAIKLAQKQIGVLEDGIIGSITIKALNNYNEDRFDKEFDNLEIDNYKKMKVFAKYSNGFVNRANFC